MLYVALTAKVHDAGAAGEHVFNGEFCSVAERVAVFINVLAPAVVMLEQQICGLGIYIIHDAEFTIRQRTTKGHPRQLAHVADVLIYACVSAAVGMPHRPSSRAVIQPRR